MKKQWRELLYKVMYLVGFCGVVALLLPSHFKAERYEEDITTQEDSISGLNQRIRALEIEIEGRSNKD